MTEGEFSAMEKDILSSENLPEQEKSPIAPNNKSLKIKTPNSLNPLAKTKNIFLFFRSPKKIIILITVLVIILTSIVFTVLFLKKEKPVPVEEIVTNIESPSPKVDEEVSRYKKEVENYNNEIDNLQKDSDDTAFPVVNLKDVKF